MYVRRYVCTKKGNGYLFIASSFFQLESYFVSILLYFSLKRPTPTHNERDIIAELARAFNVWSKETLLRFTRLGQERADEADIRIVFSK